MGIPWWQVGGFFAGGMSAGIGFVFLALYEERRAKKRSDPDRNSKNPPP
jgi:hypothetical protein